MLKERLEDVSMRAHKYQREIERLHNEARKREQDASNFIKFLQSEVKAAEIKNKTLEKEMKETIALHLNDKKQMKKTFEATLKRHEGIFLQKEAQLLERNKQLLEEVSDLSLFKKMREELAQELESTKETIAKNERRHKQQLDDLERKFVAAKQKLEQEALERIAHSRQVYKEEVGKELDMESKQVRKENRELSKELRFHEERSNSLHEENLALKNKARALTTELGLARQMEEEQVKRGMRQAKQIKELNDKVKTLERSLTQVLRDFEQERSNMKSAHESTVDTLQSQLSTHQEQHEIKARELSTIKRHAGTVLNQRTEVEQFLLESIQQVKAEIRARRDEKLRQARMSATTTQGGGGDSSRSTGSSTSGGGKRISLNDFELEDRERVLRLLFAKVSGRTPASVKAANLPRHSFDIQLDNVHLALSRHNSRPGSGPQSSAAAAAASGSQSAGRTSLLPPLPPADSSNSSLPPLLPVPNSLPPVEQPPPAAAEPPAGKDMTFLTSMDSDLSAIAGR